MSTMNWKKESERSSQTYPEGSYLVAVQNWEKTTASTGTKQICWKCKIVGGEFDGKNITDFNQLTDKSLWRLAQFVKACGIDVDKLGEMVIDSNAFYKVLDACKNRTLVWRVEIKVNNKGRKVNEVVEYLPDPNVTGGQVEGIIEDDTPDFLKEK